MDAEKALRQVIKEIILRAIRISSVVVGLMLFGADLRGVEPSALTPLQFLLGEWEAIGGGAPGEGSGACTFAGGLQDRVILRTNHAEYPASGGRPASRHDDLMVIYVDAGSQVKADYYDSEDHVIRYLVQSPRSGEVVFLSETMPSVPRYRLTYKLADNGTLDGRFEIAPPGKLEAFETYLSWSARKASRGHSGPR